MTVSVTVERRCSRLLTWATAVVLLFTLRGAHTFAAQQGRGTSTAQNHAAFVEGRVLVKFQPLATAQAINDRIAEVRASVEGEIPAAGVKILKLPSGAAADAVARAMRSRPGVEFAEVDSYVEPDNLPNDPYFSSQWHLTKIQGPTAWDTTTGSSSLTIAILDTGVDGTHPDLAGDLVPGWNFYDNNSDTSDVYGHGTAVAGAAAAMGNDAIGVASVAWNCRIMPLRISDTTGYATYSAAASALTWAADHGARVANISYSFYTSSAVLSAAQYFQGKNGGGVITMSAGNDGTTISASATPYIIVVGATDGNDNLSSYSTTGNMVNLVAPGDSIYTTASGGGYRYGSGTSFSAPITAGVAALVLSVQPGLTGPQVRNILQSSADDLGPAGWDPSFGYGRVNAAAAVAMATATPTTTANVPVDTTPPAVGFTSPANGDTISGTITSQVNATDNVGVASVSFAVDGSGVGTDTTAPYTFSVNTSNLTNGSHTLTATAKDAAGNTASTAITVTVNNPVIVGNPVVSVTSPKDGATLTKNNVLSARASDTVAVVKMELYIDGNLLSTSSTSSISTRLNTRNVASGPHVVSAKAYDASGGNAASSITVYK